MNITIRCFILAVLLIVSASLLAQAPKLPVPQITIDGQKDPDKIPEWILWREVFAISLDLSNRSAAGAREFFVSRLGLSTQSHLQLLAQAIELERQETTLNAAAQKIKGNATGPFTDAMKQQLRALDDDRHNRVLQLRDLIRGSLQPDEYARLYSWARVNLAPGIKVGTLSSSK